MLSYMHTSLALWPEAVSQFSQLFWLFMQPLFAVLLVKYFCLEHFTHSPRTPAEMLTVFQKRHQANLDYLSRNTVGSQSIIS